VIGNALDCSPDYIARWKKRFEAERLAGRYARHSGREASVLTPAKEARILDWTRREPSDGSTHWTTRKLAKALGVNYMVVARTWQRAGLRPRRIERETREVDPPRSVQPHQY